MTQKNEGIMLTTYTYQSKRVLCAIDRQFRFIVHNKLPYCLCRDQVVSSGRVDQAHFCPIENVLLPSSLISNDEAFDCKRMSLHPFHVSSALVPVNFVSIFISKLLKKLLDVGDLIRKALNDERVLRLGVGRTELSTKNSPLVQRPAVLIPWNGLVGLSLLQADAVRDVRKDSRCAKEIR